MCVCIVSVVVLLCFPQVSTLTKHASAHRLPAWVCVTTASRSIIRESDGTDDTVPPALPLPELTKRMAARLARRLARQPINVIQPQLSPVTVPLAVVIVPHHRVLYESGDAFGGVGQPLPDVYVPPYARKHAHSLEGTRVASDLSGRLPVIRRQLQQWIRDQAEETRSDVHGGVTMDAHDFQRLFPVCPCLRHNLCRTISTDC